MFLIDESLLEANGEVKSKSSKFKDEELLLLLLFKRLLFENDVVDDDVVVVNDVGWRTSEAGRSKSEPEDGIDLEFWFSCLWEFIKDNESKSLNKSSIFLKN